MYRVREIREGDAPQLRAVLSHLQSDYPGIMPWMFGGMGKTGKFAELIAGAGAVGTVVCLAEGIVGVCLSQEKTESATKIMTLFVDESVRGNQIGAELLSREIQRAAFQGKRRVYLTLPLSKFENLGPFFASFGFHLESVAPSQYSHGTSEAVMGKQLCYEMIPPHSLGSFVKTAVFEARGYQVRDHGELMVAKPLDGAIARLGMSRSKYVVGVAIDETACDEMASRASRLAREISATPLVFTNNVSNIRQLDGTTIVDAVELEEVFYPLHVFRSADPVLVHPISTQAALRLFPSDPQGVLIPPTPPRAVALDPSCEELLHDVDRIVWDVPGIGARGESRIDGVKHVKGAALDRDAVIAMPRKKQSEWVVSELASLREFPRRADSPQKKKRPIRPRLLAGPGNYEDLLSQVFPLMTRR